MRVLSLLALLVLFLPLHATDPLPIVTDVDGQPLGQNADRIAKALEFLGTPLPADTVTALTTAINARDAKKIQEILDARVLLQVTISPEARVKVAAGPGSTVIQQSGWTAALIKVANDSTTKAPLRVTSPQAGDVWSQREIKKDFTSRFLDLQMFAAPPLTKNLSGLKVEYAILLVYASEPGKRVESGRPGLFSPRRKQGRRTGALRVPCDL